MWQKSTPWKSGERASNWLSRENELKNNNSHGLSPTGGFSSLSFDQVVPYYSQPHLADQNAIYILHRLTLGQSLDVTIFVVLHLNGNR